LAYLDRYPVDILKIDRSFVTPLGQGTKSAALVRSIIDLASALEMDTVAEGVETDEQRELLRALGCRRAQGFFFAHPMPADELLERLG
jgi:EAL domain-containing protein (putative c-di-GMP-specific phosphodiesterase class I)